MDVLPGLFDSISHHGPLARCADDATAQRQNQRIVTKLSDHWTVPRGAPASLF